jgi:hypothetical protein
MAALGKLWRPAAAGSSFEYCLPHENFYTRKINIKKTMKMIKNMRVTLQYTVELSDLLVKDDIFDALCSCYDRNVALIRNTSDREEQEAFLYLNQNVNEDDAMDWSYEIDSFDE